MIYKILKTFAVIFVALLVIAVGLNNPRLDRFLMKYLNIFMLFSIIIVSVLVAVEIWR